jgi:hypothetical protein
VLLRLAEARLGLDDAAAEEDLDRSLALFEELGDEHTEAIVLRTRALLHARTGRRTEAGRSLARAAGLAAAVRNERTLATIEVALGEFHELTGRRDVAERHFRAALVTLGEHGPASWLIRAEDGLRRISEDRQADPVGRRTPGVRVNGGRMDAPEPGGPDPRPYGGERG